MMLHEINYKMPIYRDCTLGEMLFVGGTVFLCEMTFFSLMTKLLFGFAFIGVAITFVSFFHVSKYFLGRLQKVKYGKPYGYYRQLFFKKMIEHGIIRSDYVIRLGKWSVRREIK